MELSIEQALQQAVAAHQAGRLQDAEHLYRIILQYQPSHPDANHTLGVLAVSFIKLIRHCRYLKLLLKLIQRWSNFGLATLTLS